MASRHGQGLPARAYSALQRAGGRCAQPRRGHQPRLAATAAVAMWALCVGGGHWWRGAGRGGRRGPLPVAGWGGTQKRQRPPPSAPTAFPLAAACLLQHRHVHALGVVAVEVAPREELRPVIRHLPAGGARRGLCLRWEEGGGGRGRQARHTGAAERWMGARGAPGARRLATAPAAGRQPWRWRRWRRRRRTSLKVGQAATSSS